MKKIIGLFVVIVVLFSGYYVSPTFAEKVNGVLYSSPCEKPKTFSIGTIDPRFNLTKEELVADAEIAGSVWKNADGMPLLQYDPEAKMTINMIYDQRQSMNSQINNLNNQVEQQKDALKPEIAEYENRVAAFKQKSAALNSQIEHWNGKGGAPEEEYNKLNTQQQELQQEAAVLQNMASKLNQSTDEYNSQIKQLDQKVTTYNQALQYKPEEGLYVREGGKERIEIYFNNNKEELLHTLSHEMGHAIGVPHNNNKESIMFPSTTTVVTPSSEDLAGLMQVCQKRSLLQNAQTNLSYVFLGIHEAISNTLQKN